MKTIIPLVLLALAGGSFFSAASAQVYDYDSDTLIPVQPAAKVYHAIIMSPADFRALQNKNSDTIPVSRQPYTFRVDSTSTYFRMMERLQRLPGSERQEYNAIPGGRSKTGNGYMKRRVE